MKDDLARAVTRLDDSQQFVLVLPEQDLLALKPQGSFARASNERKADGAEAIKALQPDLKGDLLAAVKKAIELHEADAQSSRPAGGRLLSILTATDLSDELATFIEARHKDAVVRIRVNVLFFGQDDAEVANAKKVAEITFGSFRRARASVSSMPASARRRFCRRVIRKSGDFVGQGQGSPIIARNGPFEKPPPAPRARPLH